MEFSCLNERQQFMLALTAWQVSALTEQQKSFAAGHLGVGEQETEVILKELEDKDLYKMLWGINRDRLIEAIIFTHEAHPELIELFRDSGLQRSPFVHEIWSACISAENGEQVNLSKDGKDSRNLGKLVLGLIFCKRYYRIIDSLTGREFSHLFSPHLEELLKQDRLTAEMLDNAASNIETFSKTHQILFPSAIQGEIDLYRFFISGIRPKTDSQGREPLDAVMQLYRGDTVAALDIYDKILGHRQTNVGGFLSTFYYILALHMAGLQDRFDKAAAQTQDPILKLLCTYRKLGKEQISSRIKALVESAPPLGKQILFLISQTAKLPNYQGYNKLERLPGTRAMLEECSPFLILDDKTKEDLDILYPGGPILSAIKNGQDWATTMDALQQSLTTARAVGTRIKYIYYDGSLIGLREQKATPQGTWQDERILSYSQFLDGAYPFMDDIDVKVASVLRTFNKSRSFSIFRNEGEAILPILAGTDRLYSPTGQITIVTQMPSLHFGISEDGDMIVATSNAEVDPSGHVASCTITSDADNCCTIVTPDNRQRQILEMLLRTGRMPVSAVASIVELAEKMRGILDVNYETVAAIKDAVNEQGCGKIIVQIVPDKGIGSFSITWMAQPFAGGSKRFDPGDGQEDYLEKTEDGYVHITRDMDKEIDNLNDLTDFITSIPNYAARNSRMLIVQNTVDLLPILEFLHDRPDDYAMEWPEGTEIKFRGRASASSWEIGLSSGIDWFGIEGNLNVGGQKIPVKKILSADLHKETEFIEIGEQEYIRISKMLLKQLSALQNLTIGTNCDIPKYQVGRLAEVLGMGELPLQVNEEYQMQLSLIQEADELSPAPPAGLKAKLRDYQLEGFRWMTRLAHWGAGGCLADDMGLGKTIQTIAFMLDRSAKGPSLVIAPTSVVPNWEKEIARFAPSLRTLAINATKDRGMVAANAGPGDVVLASYGVLVNSSEALSSRSWNVICLDEAHQIKNRWTKMSRAAMELEGEGRLILTGTPVQNSINDLWNLFQFINPGMLGKFDTFRGRFYSPNEDEARQKLEELKVITQPFILRRTKQDVLSELPKKTEIDYIVHQSPEEAHQYESMRSEISEGFLKLNMPKPDPSAPAQGKGQPQQKQPPPKSQSSPQPSAQMQPAIEISIFQGLTKLRMACCSMELQNPVWEGGSSKLSELHFILEHIYDKDSKILIFSQFTSFLAMAGDVLKDFKIPFLYLDGTTPMKQRSDLVEDFQSGRCPVFLISLKAGGLGLNLTEANYVILLDPWWNPSVEEQAIDRAYRIGQTRDVTVIRMITENTIEQKIVQLQDKKRNISDNILSGTGASSSLTLEEIREMLSR